jgi:spore coat protein CotH
MDGLNVATNYEATVNSMVDVRQWMRTYAVDDLGSFWDAFGNPGLKNSFLYKPERDTWKIMSWDFDVGIGVFNDPTNLVLLASNIEPTL